MPWVGRDAKGMALAAFAARILRWRMARAVQFGGLVIHVLQGRLDNGCRFDGIPRVPNSLPSPGISSGLGTATPHRTGSLVSKGEGDAGARMQGEDLGHWLLWLAAVACG